MAVKAREVIKIESFSFKQLLALFIALIGVELFLNYIKDRISENMQFTINLIVLAITIGLLIILITKLLPRYELMVVDESFIIYRSLLFKPKLVLAVRLIDITSIEKKYEIDKLIGKKKNFTLWGLKDKLEYVATFEASGKVYNAHFQASNKFIDKLIKTREKNLKK